MEKQKIMIVDDNEMNRDLLADILEDDYDIIQAKNGLEAVAILNEDYYKISLVLLDMVMPEMDGLGVLEVMNRKHWIDTVPVVMISVEDSADYIKRAYDLGVTDYIKRPFDALAVRRRSVNTMALYANQRKLVNLVTEQVYEKEKSTALMINILSHIVEFRNGESGLHVLHIRTITQTLLNRYAEMHKEAGLTRSEISNIVLASALHDIGKISIPEKILNKPGRLTTEEFEIMKTHSAIGSAMLDNLPFQQDEPLVKLAYSICRWHHERFDGNGYPDGLKGNEIPLAAQVVAAADVYDALTSERVYKEAYSHERAMEMILGGECGSFNPDIIECLKDTSETLAEELKLNTETNISQHEIQTLAEEMLRQNNLNVSDQTLSILDSERVKWQFLNSVSREIQFDYISDPPMLTLSAWCAEQLGLWEYVFNPKEVEQVASILSKDDLNKISELVNATTPDDPVVEYECDMKIDGTVNRYRIICRSLWNKDGYTGAVGKVLDLHDTRTIDYTYMTTHDPLTGLLKLSSARKQIDEIIEQDRSGKYALIVISLEYFKFSGSDKQSHSFRDGVRKLAAKKLKNAIDAGDIVAKIDDVSFLVFFGYDTSPYEKLDKLVSEISVKNDDFSICAYTGVALTENSFGGCDVLLDKAATQAYENKTGRISGIQKHG